MNAARLLSVGIPLMLAAVALPLPTAQALALECGVGPGNDACIFACVRGILHVETFGGDFGAFITGSCGIGTVSCFAPPFDICSATGPSYGGVGMCRLDDFGAPDATGACSG
jgi:hypothetical protein